MSSLNQTQPSKENKSYGRLKPPMKDKQPSDDCEIQAAWKYSKLLNSFLVQFKNESPNDTFFVSEFRRYHGLISIKIRSKGCS